MLLTQQDHSPNRPIAKHGRKPDRSITIAMIEARLIELPAISLRRQVLEQMIERERD
jgi:hypothetical protein